MDGPPHCSPEENLAVAAISPTFVAAASTFYERPKGETTEWEDILRDKGIIPPKEVRRRGAAALQAPAKRLLAYTSQPLGSRACRRTS